MNSLLFPGQGSQVVGMGIEFYKNYEIVKKIFKQADEKLNYSLSKIILEGPENDLQLTKNTQPSILTVSYSIFKILKEEFGFNLQSFKFFAGHSLGEYSALVSSGAIEFSDAIYLLHERGKAMQESVPVGERRCLERLPTQTIIQTDVGRWRRRALGAGGQSQSQPYRRFLPRCTGYDCAADGSTDGDLFWSQPAATATICGYGRARPAFSSARCAASRDRKGPRWRRTLPRQLV